MATDALTLATETANRIALAAVDPQNYPTPAEIRDAGCGYLADARSVAIGKLRDAIENLISHSPYSEQIAAIHRAAGDEDLDEFERDQIWNAFHAEIDDTLENHASEADLSEILDAAQALETLEADDDPAALAAAANEVERYYSRDVNEVVPSSWIALAAITRGDDGWFRPA